MIRTTNEKAITEGMIGIQFLILSFSCKDWFLNSTFLSSAAFILAKSCGAWCSELLWPSFTHWLICWGKMAHGIPQYQRHWLMVDIMSKSRIAVLCHDKRAVLGERRDLVLQGKAPSSAYGSQEELVTIVPSSAARNPVKEKILQNCSKTVERETRKLLFK